ncbi:RNI-like protein [Exidia glandulosa HHB12029]|uniref:RNI-like protein n=1 Tax=Exidia glandulosa HHB12029 TaxID=1314781 RepID=A0A165C5W8_EXIGL|nr:RNI-like protein [Exidia glandulosa HHB12029]
MRLDHLRLPPELLVHVIAQLDNHRDIRACILVSREWCQCGMRHIWDRPPIRGEDDAQRIFHILETPDTLFPYATFVHRLNLRPVYKTLTDNDIDRVGLCVNLERLTLAGCGNLSSDALIRLFTRLPKLASISAQEVLEINDAVLLAIARSCRGLQGLDITGCHSVTDEGVTALAKACPSFLRIKLAAVRSLTDSSLSALALHCRKLCEVDVMVCHNVTDDGVRSLWNCLPRLRDLRLSGCVLVGPAAFPSSPTTPLPLAERKLTALRELQLVACAHITDDTIAGIVAHAPLLRQLELSRCTLLTDSALISISKLGPRLHDLHLTSVTSITDDAVGELVKCCPNIKYIELGNCTNLTNESVLYIAARLPRLRRLGLARVSNITDEAIMRLVSARANTLERLHLSYCDKITLQPILAIIRHVKNLTHLSVSGLPEVLRWHDLRTYSLPPPEDLGNEQHRAAFCVFGGKGLRDLKVRVDREIDRVAAARAQMQADAETRVEGDSVNAP